MKKEILAMSKNHIWVCGIRYSVEKFRDACGRIRYQVLEYDILHPKKIFRRYLISKQAIIAMADDDYKWPHHYSVGVLSVPSPFGERVSDDVRHGKIVKQARMIVRELGIE